jgi:hypothetical protein
VTPEARPPLYGLQVAALGMLISTLAVVLTVWTIVSVLGPFRFFESESTRDRVLGLWHPPSARERAAAVARTWRAVAPGFAIRESASIEELAGEGLGLLVVSDARGLTRGERLELERFLHGGGAAIVTGAVGIRTPSGEWIGLDLMRRLLRTRDLEPIPIEATPFVQAARRGPLSAPLDPGERIALAPSGEAVAVTSPDAELRWLAEGLVAASAGGAALRVHIGQGKLIWLGAGPASLASPHGAEAMAGLVEAAAAWARDEPFVELLTWPERALLAARFTGRPRLLGLPDPPSRAKLEYEIEAAARSGGLVRISLPPELPRGDPRVGLLEHARVELERRRAWIARPGELAEWHRLRSGIAARSERVGPHRTLIHVTNGNDEPVRGLVLRVHTNAQAASARVGRTTVQQAIPFADIELSRQRIDIVLPELAPRSNVSYTIDLEPSRRSSGSPG